MYEKLAGVLQVLQPHTRAAADKIDFECIVFYVFLGS